MNVGQISSVKQKIHEEKGFDPKLQKLIYAGKSFLFGAPGPRHCFYMLTRSLRQDSEG